MRIIHDPIHQIGHAIDRIQHFADRGVDDRQPLAEQILATYPLDQIHQPANQIGHVADRQFLDLDQLAEVGDRRGLERIEVQSQSRIVCHGIVPSKGDARLQSRIIHRHQQRSKVRVEIGLECGVRIHRDSQSIARASDRVEHFRQGDVISILGFDDLDLHRSGCGTVTITNSNRGQFAQTSLGLNIGGNRGDLCVQHRRVGQHQPHAILGQLIRENGAEQNAGAALVDSHQS